MRSGIASKLRTRARGTHTPEQGTSGLAIGHYLELCDYSGMFGRDAEQCWAALGRTPKVVPAAAIRHASYEDATGLPPRVPAGYRVSLETEVP